MYPLNFDNGQNLQKNQFSKVKTDTYSHDQKITSIHFQWLFDAFKSKIHSPNYNHKTKKKIHKKWKFRQFKFKRNHDIARLHKQQKRLFDNLLDRPIPYFENFSKSKEHLNLKHSVNIPPGNFQRWCSSEFILHSFCNPRPYFLSNRCRKMNDNPEIISALKIPFLHHPPAPIRVKLKRLDTISQF